MSVQCQLGGSGSLDTKHQTLLTFNVVAFKQITCECEIQLGNIPPFKDKTTHIPLSWSPTLEGGDTVPAQSTFQSQHVSDGCSSPQLAIALTKAFLPTREVVCGVKSLIYPNYLKNIVRQTQKKL